MSVTTISVRTSARHLRTSSPVLVCVFFLIFLLPLTVGLWVAGRAYSDDETVSFLYNIALAAPAMGILLAVVSLVAVLWRRTRPVLLIDDRVRLPGTGVTFATEELDRIEMYVRGGSHLVLLPRHLGPGVSVQESAKAVASYDVALPEGSNWQPVELADELRRRVPGLIVMNHGTM